MGRMIFGMALAVALAACSSDSRPPSCQQAIGHYYGAGCVYFDSTTNPPTPITQVDMAGRCQQLAAAAPAQCQDEIDAWSSCNGSVPSPASSNAQCDCSSEYMALLQCR